MKIISKFSDYYDSGIAYGIDHNLRFTRKSATVGGAISIETPSIINSDKHGEALRAVLYFKLLGFCGQIYPLVHIVLEERIRENKKESFIKLKEVFSYDIDTAEKFLNTYIRTIRKATENSKKQRGYNGYYMSSSWWKRDVELKEFFTQKIPKAETLFFKYNTPYFLLEMFTEKDANGYTYPKHKNTLLPVLKSVKFSQVKQPIEAFQEISMFLGHLGTQEDNTVSIGDKYLAQAKGFDCYSFKKEPEKKPRKKC